MAVIAAFATVMFLLSTPLFGDAKRVCRIECVHPCNALHMLPAEGCKDCKPQIGNEIYQCYPGAKGYDPPTPEEEREIAISGLVAGLTACSALESAVEVHVRYFHGQQAQERLFVHSLHELCKVPPADYYPKLHELRKPMMAAINLHVQGAFFVKAACTSAAFEIFPDKVETYICNPPVLDHEPYNLVEGYYVVNLTDHLLRAGPGGFCNSPEAKPGGLARWENELEDVMSQHRNNKRFDALWDQFQDICDDLALAPNPRVYTIRGKTAAIDCNSTTTTAEGASDADGTKTTCAVARTVSPSRIQMDDAIDTEVRNPTQCECHVEGTKCTVTDAINIVGNDTLVMIEGARRSIMKAYSNACPGAANAERSAKIAQLASLTKARGNIRPSPDSFYVSVTLSTIYHKIVPYCGNILIPNDPLGLLEPTSMYDLTGATESHLCLGPGGPNGGGHDVPVMDIVPSTDPVRCSANTATAVADAVDSYHALLDKLTPVRTRLLEIFFDPKHQLDILGEEGDSMFNSVAARVEKECLHKKSAAKLERLVDDTLELIPMLEDALRRLRASVDGFDLTCVADSRKAEVFLTHGTSRKLADLVQEAATVRVARDGGGLPIKVSLASAESTPGIAATPGRPRDWEPARARRYIEGGDRTQRDGEIFYELKGQLSVFLGVGLLGIALTTGIISKLAMKRTRGESHAKSNNQVEMVVKKVVVGGV